MEKILIVDDSVVMRRLLEKYAGTLGLEIVGTAQNGRIGVEMFKKHLPDFVTLDITMPEMDGIEALKEMIKVKPQVLIVVITALADPDTGLEAIRLGAKAFIQKPFTEDQVREELEILLQMKRGSHARG